MSTTDESSALRGLLGLVAALAVLPLLEGCRTYQPKPVDLEATERAFDGRDAAAILSMPPLSEFARTLVGDPAGTATFDPSDGLSVDEAAAVALVFNRELRLARLAAGVARANAENSGLWRDPVLGIDVSDVLAGTANGLEAIVSIGLTLPLSGRLELERERLGAEHGAELARVAADEWRVVGEVRRAFLRRAAKAAQVAAARDVIARAGEVARTVDRMESAGEIARIEARLFRIEDATLRSRLGALEAELLAASTDLDALLGLPPDPGRTYAIELAAPTPVACRTRLAASPMLAVARAELAVAEKRLEEEIRAQWPDLEIAPGYGEQDGDRQFVLGLGVALPVLNGNRRGIAEADAAREVARLRLEAGFEGALTELAASEARLATARSRRTSLEETLVPLVDLQYEEARAVARLGEIEVLVLLECIKQQFGAKLDLVEARLAESIAAFDVLEALGPEPPAATAEESR